MNLRGVTLFPFTRSAIAALALLFSGLVSPIHAQWLHVDNNSDIRAIYEHDDVLWVGTNGGVVTIDALTHDVTGKIGAGDVLPGNSVRAITGRGNAIYVGTDNGLSVIGPTGTEIFTADESDVFRRIRHLSFGPRSKLFVGTYGNGLGILQNGKLFHLTTADSLLDNKVYAVAPAKDDDTYFATSLGLCAVIDSLWVGFQAGAGLPRGEVTNLIRDGRHYYLLIAGRGIYRFNGRRGKRIETGDVFPGGDVAAICVDNKRRLWAAGRFGGIGRFQNDHWTAYAEGDRAVAENQWRCAYSASDGSVYFGSANGMVVAIEQGDVRKIELPSALPSGHVGRMVEDSEGQTFIINGGYVVAAPPEDASFSVDAELGSVFDIAASPRGVIWAATSWGLLKRDGGEWVNVLTDIEPRIPLFVSLAFDPLGHLWLGGHRGEIFRYGGALWVRYAGARELASTPIHRLVVDGARDVWAFSRHDGVHRSNGYNWDSFDTSVVGSRPVVDATRDIDGQVLVLTDEALWKFQTDDTWRSIELPGISRGGELRAVAVASGRVFVGGRTGVAVLSEGSVRWYDPRGGLQGHGVTSLLVDRANRLWVGFDGDGLSRVVLDPY